ncbi:MAG: MOSC domain-containing protein [Acetobacteraceae bacterium]
MGGPAIGWRGVVLYLHRTEAVSRPMAAEPKLNLIADRGIEGDRYLLGTGFYSNKPEVGRQVTLFEMETLEALARDQGLAFGPHEHRRNVTVRGVPLNHLVGQRFLIGTVLVEATRLSVPCHHLEEVSAKRVFKALLHRAGLNCRILRSGVIAVGDTVRPAD